MKPHRRMKHEEGGAAESQGLVGRLRRGEAAAVADVRRMVRRILRYRGFGMGPQDREDLEQEIMAQVWQVVNRRDFPAERELRGFVSMIAARRSIDWLRTRKSTVPLEEADGKPSERSGPLEASLSSEQARLALAALRGLSRSCRELVFLRVGLAKSYREISRLTGRSEGALRTQFCRCVEVARLSIRADSDLHGRRKEGL